MCGSHIFLLFIERNFAGRTLINIQFSNFRLVLQRAAAFDYPVIADKRGRTADSYFNFCCVKVFPLSVSIGVRNADFDSIQACVANFRGNGACRAGNEVVAYNGKAELGVDCLIKHFVERKHAARAAAVAAVNKSRFRGELGDFEHLRV